MYSKYFLRSLLLFFLFSSLTAKTIEVNTGRRIFDTQRLLVVDEFDYLYPLKQSHLHGHFIELEEGSIWKIESLSIESNAFYENKGETPRFVEQIVEDWQPGELLIFHKVLNRESLLIYNLTRDLLIDASPFFPSTSGTTITELDYSNHLITLSDSSTWSFDHLCACKKWKIGNPILVAKNTPWKSDHTHILINLTPCECIDTVGHIHPNRLGVRRIN